MKTQLKLGFAACLTAAFLFSGCQKDDDDVNPSSKKNRHLLSVLCEWTDAGGTHQDIQENTFNDNWNVTLQKRTRIDDGVVTSCIQTENKFNDKGRNIWSLSTYTYNGVIERKDERTIKYNDNGVWEEYQWVYESVDNGKSSEISKYNERGDQTERIVTDNSGSVTLSWEYQYDDNGDKTEIKHYRNGELRQIIKIEYDEKRNTTKTEIYNNNPLDKTEFYKDLSLREKTEYTYEGNTVKSAGESYLPDGTITSTTVGLDVYTDATRNYLKTSTSTTTYSDGSTKTAETKCSYDSNGRQTMREEYENGKLTYKSTDEGNIYFYGYYNYSHDYGEMISSETHKTIYTDSSHGNILSTEETRTDSNGTTVDKSEYIYDNNGNEIGYKRYYNGYLSYEYIDYVYDGNKVTYTEYDYYTQFDSDGDNGQAIHNGTRYFTLIYAD